MQVAAACIRYPNLQSPDRDDENATFEPSEDQAGDKLLPPAEPPGKLTTRPKSKEYMRIAQPLRPSVEKAMRELSGEMRGESEMLPRCVIWC